jgi:aspartate ammonia-lyase
MFRIERDLLGTKDVPADAYYGVHTARALENFAITGTPISTYPDLIIGIASVKLAAALANRDLGRLDDERANAIAEACRAIRRGAHHQHFVVDVMQGGAGTSTNMNANEVIANLALELLGHRPGDYHVIHPLEHVNLGQSTNDVYPTALKVGLLSAIGELRASMTALSEAFAEKALDFADVLKIGRTQLQDAVPMTLGQEFGAYAVMIIEDRDRLGEAAQLISEINLGGTAIGTGLNSHPAYAATACRHLAEITGLALSTATNLIEATQDVGSLVQLSGTLKRTAVKLSKICNDLRLLSSGPRAGFNEINLPARQAGSSIMPGKVNPVIPEAVNQVAFKVMGHDVTVGVAAEAGQLQLNAFEPVIAHCLFESIKELTAACDALMTKCVCGITANTEQLRVTVERSIGVVTALVPHIGYDAASQVASQALVTGGGVRELLLEMRLLSAAQLDAILRAENLTNPVDESAIH